MRELVDISNDPNRSPLDRESARRGARRITIDLANSAGLTLTPEEIDGATNPLLVRIDGWGKGNAKTGATADHTPVTLPSLLASEGLASNTPTALEAKAAIGRVRAAVEAEFGDLPDKVEIIHDPYAVDPQTGQPWAARIQGGQITPNAAHVTAQDAADHIEHEAIHDLYRKASEGDPQLRHQWETVNKIVDQHPDLAQQVVQAAYHASVRAEEISVNLAQRLAVRLLGRARVNLKSARSRHGGVGITVANEARFSYKSSALQPAKMAAKRLQRRREALRRLYMGKNPGKESATGKAVISRMMKEGKIRQHPISGGLRFLSTNGNWYPIELADMAHVVDAVRWWNETGREFGARSSPVRQWMLDPSNYSLEYFRINRALGSQVGHTYLPPLHK